MGNDVESITPSDLWKGGWVTSTEPADGYTLVEVRDPDGHFGQVHVTNAELADTDDVATPLLVARRMLMEKLLGARSDTDEARTAIRAAFDTLPL